MNTTTTTTRFNAVSNCDWRGYPPSRQFPADEESFQTLEAAVQWLKSKKCGGAVSAHVAGDFRLVATLAPGADAEPVRLGKAP